MDANKTRYQLLLGKDDWGQCLSSGVALSSLWSYTADPQAAPVFWDDRRKQLRLASSLFEVRGNPSALSPDVRRGADFDRYGNVYWIDSSNQKILVLSVGSNTVSEFWPAGCTCGNGGVSETACPRCGPSVRPPVFQPIAETHSDAPPSFAGLAVTSDNYLVVGNIDPPGFLIFDLFAGGPPIRMLWPSAISLQPFDMASDADGGGWVLDRNARRLWGLDRRFEVIDLNPTAASPDPVPDAFQPAEGGPVRNKPIVKIPQSLDLSTLTPPVVDPISICCLPDGSVLLLDRRPGQLFSSIYLLQNGSQSGTPVDTSAFAKLVQHADQAGFQLTGHDFAFVPVASNASSPAVSGTGLGTLSIASSDGVQCFAFEVAIDAGQLLLDPITNLLPMRQFGGKAIISNTTTVDYDFGSTWIPLVAQMRPRYVTSATLITPQTRPTPAGTPQRGFFDGRIPGCVWHRIMLDASIPTGASILFSARAADDVDDLSATAWESQPSPYLRGDGSELPFLQAVPPSRNGVQTNGTWELLLQNAIGRYLQIQIQIQSDGRDTPRLRALRIYYPRFSYPKNYLPAIYRDDPVPSSFLDRYLANVEGFYTAIEDKINAVSMLMDYRSVPTSAIEWLIGWYGVTANTNWSEANRRLFIKYAMTMFQYRGTVRGLRMALALVLDTCPDEGLFVTPPNENPGSLKTQIVEGFQTRTTPAVVYGDTSNLSGLRQVTQGALWQPGEGGASLSARYAAAVGKPAGTPYPIRDPGGNDSENWQGFSEITLGFVPSATDADQAAWTSFLRRRHTTVDTLNSRYNLILINFLNVQVPKVLPPDGAQLTDWYVFESVVLAVRRTAHRFTVLLPVPRKSIFNTAQQTLQLALAQQVIAMEKPAHTVFSVKFYYAMFQVGMARLGIDTSLEQGSRSPDLMPPMVLGSGYVSESYLAPRFPQDARARRFLGQGKLSAGTSVSGGASTQKTVPTGDCS